MAQRFFARRAAAVLAVALIAGAASGSALAASKKEKKAATQPSKSVKFIPGSQETTRERTTRLKRECKGRVNAGACEGHTQ